MKTSILVLVFSLLVALGSWIAGFDAWAECLQTKAVAGLIGIESMIVLAWLGKSPIQPKTGGTNARK